jgi:hypothetical protein
MEIGSAWCDGGRFSFMDRQRVDADPVANPTFYFDAGGSGSGPHSRKGQIIQILCGKELTNHNLAIKS